MVTCDVAVSPGAVFTGSVLCGDKAYVLAEAQAQEGSLVSMKLAVHAVAGPLLGVLADRAGRRPVLIMSLGGFTLAFCLFAAISAQRGLPSRLPLMRLCFFVEGATNAFDVVYGPCLPTPCLWRRTARGRSRPTSPSVLPARWARSCAPPCCWVCTRTRSRPSGAR
ncbi:unnamed protein product [Prorocentrum cordatum]|uniref:Major facilitator superfamily (MFS) profile domain-containing protein n=1 Tax=Prorocentrum cordatum TaxID=2364126 RepID=A0ABN9RZC2_9DINO|nr:unnamed protein product [Polarella glacialis]